MIIKFNLEKKKWHPSEKKKKKSQSWNGNVATPCQRRHNLQLTWSGKKKKKNLSWCCIIDSSLPAASLNWDQRLLPCIIPQTSSSKRETISCKENAVNSRQGGWEQWHLCVDHKQCQGQHKWEATAVGKQLLRTMKAGNPCNPWYCSGVLCK